jgi:hypothetical protein
VLRHAAKPDASAELILAGQKIAEKLIGEAAPLRLVRTQRQLILRSAQDCVLN